MATETKLVGGLKKMRNPNASRRDEWNRPNRKAAARLALRIKMYEKEGKTRDNGFCKPGSLKCY